MRANQLVPAVVGVTLSRPCARLACLTWPEPTAAAGLHFPNQATPESLGSGSHSGSQRRQPPSDIGRPRATVIPAEKHMRPYQATFRHRWDAPCKRTVSGSNPLTGSTSPSRAETRPSGPGCAARSVRTALIGGRLDSAWRERNENLGGRLDSSQIPLKPCGTKNASPARNTRRARCRHPGLDMAPTDHHRPRARGIPHDRPADPRSFRPLPGRNDRHQHQPSRPFVPGRQISRPPAPFGGTRPGQASHDDHSAGGIARLADPARPAAAAMPGHRG